MVVPGDTVILLVVLPLLHKNVLPLISLVAVIVLLSPTHISVLVAVTFTTGSGFTVICMPAVPVQPLAEVPVTVYVVVLVGPTVIDELVEPLLQ